MVCLSFRTDSQPSRPLASSSPVLRRDISARYADDECIGETTCPYGTVGSWDAAVERTGTYSQGELRSKRGCPGVQRVP